MSINEFIQHLDGVKPDSNGYVARCPAHDDTTPSLSISTGDDGRILLKCHAGCSIEAVLATLSLEMKDLYSSITHYIHHPLSLSQRCIPLALSFIKEPMMLC